MNEKFLYTQKIDIDGENVQGIMEFANYINLKNVVEICSNFIIKNIDDSNFGDVLVFGDNMGNNKLVKEAVRFIADNLQQCLKDDEDLKVFLTSTNVICAYSVKGILCEGSKKRICTKRKFSIMWYL